MSPAAIAFCHKWLTTKVLDPWEFCKQWFGASEEETQERGYRSRCVRLLAQTLKVSDRTVEGNWGSHFEGMPDYHRVSLERALALREIVDVVSKYPELRDRLNDKDTE